ncbi:hypothetical protein PQI23_04040 [Leucobacter sp. USCH14]|uniref:hypothetical protein n=1 Tax=Leucobacter sp. USCH14 TaxID=3024838 RepID=UPI0030AA07F8
MIPFRLSARVQPRARGSSPTARAGPVIAAAPAAPAAPAAVRDDPSAIEAPWRVSKRSASGVIEVENMSAAALHAVCFSLAGDGLLGLSLPRTVLPGERLRVALRGTRAEAASDAADSLLVLRWFQPDGRELLWPVSLL